MSLRQIQIPVFRSPQGAVVAATLEFVLVNAAGAPVFATNVGLNEEVVGFARVVSGAVETTVLLTPNTELGTLLGVPTWYAVTVWQGTTREIWRFQVDAGASVLPWQQVKAAGAPLPPDSIVYHLTKDWFEALSSANAPTAANPIATMDDIVAGSGGTGVTYLQDATPTNPQHRQTWFRKTTGRWMVYDTSAWRPLSLDGEYF